MLLVDSNHLASRCRYAIGGLTRDDGHPSGTVHGFLQSLAFIKHKLGESNEEVICFWDGGRSRKRMELYPDYKKRDPAKKDEEQDKFYYAQCEALQRALPYRGIRCVKVPHVEADDLIGIYSKMYEERGAYIFSGDKDMHQLISDTVHIVNSDGDLMNKVVAFSEWGVMSTRSIVLVRAICGDKSDNIDGVRGVGPKRAAIAVQHFEKFGAFNEDYHVSEKERKYIKAVADAQDIVVRNVKLMRIPRTWETSYYGDNERSQAEEQINAKHVKDLQKFIGFLNAWNLNEVLDRISMW